MLQVLKQQERNGKGATGDAGVEDTVVPSREPFQLQKHHGVLKTIVLFSCQLLGKRMMTTGGQGLTISECFQNVTCVSKHLDTVSPRHRCPNPRSHSSHDLHLPDKNTEAEIK